MASTAQRRPRCGPLHGRASDAPDGRLQGAVRGRKIKTTRSDTRQISPADYVKRAFSAQAPNVLWVSDFTYVATWRSFVYVAFAIDAFARRVVGWRVASAPNIAFVLDALEQAIYERMPGRGPKLIHHSDRGAQYL